MKSAIRKPDFIKSILNYDEKQLTERLCNLIATKYLTDPHFTFELVYTASKACGPLVKWVEAMVISLLQRFC